MMLLIAAAFLCSDTGKPTVPLEESCREARAVLVVEPTADAGVLRVLEVLYDGTKAGLKKNATIAVDLKGLVYDRGDKYILFLKPGEKPKTYQAVQQMRTEDAKRTRERVVDILRKSGKLK